MDVGWTRRRPRGSFEPFFATKFMGRGIGLAATLGMVTVTTGRSTSIDGRAPGQGTLMTVWVPLAEQVRTATKTRGSGGRRLSADGGRNRPGDRRSRRHCPRRSSRSCPRWATYVVGSYNEVEAATAFLDTNAEDVDVVVLDMNMPLVSSEELFKRVQSRCKGAPIIV